MGDERRIRSPQWSPNLQFSGRVSSRRRSSASSRAAADCGRTSRPSHDPQLGALRPAPSPSSRRLRLGSPGPGHRGRARGGLLFAGPGAALASLTALWWLRLLNGSPSADPRRLPAAGPLPRRHRDLTFGGPRPPPPPRPPRRPPPRGAARRRRGSLSRNSLRLVLARAEFEHLLDRPDARGRPSQRAPRHDRAPAAVDAHLPALARCANGFERDFVLLCERYRLPIPEPNVRIGRYRPDMLWREARLIVELDGRDAHSTPAQLAADARRQAELEPAATRSCASPPARSATSPSGSRPSSVSALG